MKANSTIYVTPKMGSGGVNLRSQPVIDPMTRVGGLPEGARLELDEAGVDWHACKVYVSKDVADIVGEHFVTLKPNWTSINIRLVPVLNDATDVGDLNSGMQLERLGAVGDWWVARVYASAQFLDIASDANVGLASTMAAPATILMTEDELKTISLAPAQQRGVPAGFSQDAITAAKTWNSYGGMIELLSNRLGIDPASAVGVIAVESGGNAFGADGRMIIRFENHVFWNNWGQQNAEIFNQLFSFNGATPWQGHKYRNSPNTPWQEVHTGQQFSEWNALGVASGLSDHAAKLSISMGMAQIMGFNFKVIGYNSVEDMFNAFASDVKLQLLGVFSFIAADPSMLKALRQNDYRTFARLYNGPGQPEFYANVISVIRDAFNSLTTTRGVVRSVVSASTKTSVTRAAAVAVRGIAVPSIRLPSTVRTASASIVPRVKRINLKSGAAEDWLAQAQRAARKSPRALVFQSRPKTRGAAATTTAMIALTYLHAYMNIRPVDSNACGQAAIATILDFHGKDPFGLSRSKVDAVDGKLYWDDGAVIDAVIAAGFGPDTPRGLFGSTPSRLQGALAHFGLNAQVTYNVAANTDAAWQTLQAFVAQGRPAPVLVDCTNIGGPKFGLHWAIVYRIENDQVYLGNWRSEPFPRQVFMNAWKCSFIPAFVRDYHLCAIYATGA